MKTISFLPSYSLSITPHTFKFDAPERWQLLFQDVATKIMDNIIDLHHDIMFFLVVISTFVFYMLMRIVLAFRIENTETIRTLTLQHHTWIEVIGALVLAVILMFIVLHSSTIVYALDPSDQACWSKGHDMPVGGYYSHYLKQAHDAIINVQLAAQPSDPIMTIYKYHNDHGSGVMIFDHVNKTWTMHPDVVPDNQPSEPKGDTKVDPFMEQVAVAYALGLWTACFLTVMLEGII